MARHTLATGQIAPLAKPIIGNHHPHLHNVRIEYVFRDKTATKAGKAVLGSARLVRGLSAMLSTPGATDTDDNDYFVIELSEEAWALLSTDKRKALLDHELSHCQVAIDPNSGEVKLSIRPHDLEEFSGVVARHGLWMEDIEEFLKALGKKQLNAVAAQLPGI